MIWTDVFQFSIMCGGLLAILIQVNRDEIIIMIMITTTTITITITIITVIIILILIIMIVKSYKGHASIGSMRPNNFSNNSNDCKKFIKREKGGESTEDGRRGRR